VECPEHGVRQIPVPWADSNATLTALCEVSLVEWIKEASASAVARRCRLSWDVIDGVIERAVARGLARRDTASAEHISIDETSFQKRHEYVTIVTDSTTGALLHVADARSTASLEEFYRQLSQDRREGIRSVSMNKWEASIKATRAHLPDADDRICFDKYHVASHLGNAVDKTRRAEHRELSSDGDHRLRKSRYLWLTNPHLLSTKQWKLFNTLYQAALKTADAWGLKELAMDLWHYVHPAWARKAWKRWIRLAETSDVAPMRMVARMIKEHLHGIINAIILKRTNAIAQSVNSRVQKIKARACGYRNRERFRNAIEFHCVKLDLYPDSFRPPVTHTEN